MRIGIKKVEDGVFSGYVNSQLKIGDEIEVMTPTGRFGAPLAHKGRRNFAAFAAGSGITPILSIMRRVLAREKESRFFLFYGNRSTEEILFREALEELKDRFTARLSIFHVLSREEQDIEILNGRLDGEKVELVMRRLVPLSTIDDVFICGPLAMSEEIEATLLRLGLAQDRIHIERFVSEYGGRPRVKKAPVLVPDAPSRIATLIHDGKRREVKVAEGEAVLDAALRAGMDLPFACKGGMCSTCRAKLVEGEVKMELNYSLEPWELKAGFILTCQSHPTTERVVVDYDQL